jgi:hypothetical protein
MSSQQAPMAVAVARAHVDAWGGHDYDSARASLLPALACNGITSDSEPRLGGRKRVTAEWSEKRRSRTGVDPRSKPELTAGLIELRKPGSSLATGSTAPSVG